MVPQTAVVKRESEVCLHTMHKLKHELNGMVDKWQPLMTWQPSPCKLVSRQALKDVEAQLSVATMAHPWINDIIHG